MRDIHLFSFVMVLVIIDVIFITIWVYLDPLHPEDIIFDEKVRYVEWLKETRNRKWPSIHPSTHLSIYPPIYLFIHHFIIHLFVRPSIYPLIHQPVHPSLATPQPIHPFYHSTFHSNVLYVQNSYSYFLFLNRKSLATSSSSQY